MPGPRTCCTDRRFLVEVTEAPPHLLLRVAGVPTRTSIARLEEGLLEARRGRGERLVVDLTDATLSPALTSMLADGIANAQRAGRRVTLVRCGEDVAQRLATAGVRDVGHAPSLAGATFGSVRSDDHALDVYLRSDPGALQRVREVLAIVCDRLGPGHPAGFAEAVTAVAESAIRDRSPEGVRNHIRLSFARTGTSLVVDVSDQAGAQEAEPPLPPLGHLQARLERLCGESGSVVRLTAPL